MLFMIGLIILLVKKVMLNILLIIVSQELELIHYCTYRKNTNFSYYNTHEVSCL